MLSEETVFNEPSEETVFDDDFLLVLLDFLEPCAESAAEIFVLNPALILLAINIVEKNQTERRSCCEYF